MADESTRADFATKPTLAGQKVVLRPFWAEDVRAIAEIVRDPHVRRYTGGAHLEFDEQHLRRVYSDRTHQADRLDLAVIDRASGELVGEVVLNEWDEHNRSCNFRILLGPRGCDRGLGTEATRLVVGHGFERLHLHRISLHVYAFNPRARHVYEKIGFAAEGIERESLLHEGEWIDAVRMALLDRDWQQLRDSAG
jgi:RimJ/RimL family protein N-acetyltransferase